MKPLLNLGLQYTDGKRYTDWVAGGAVSIPYEIVNESGDWSGYIPPIELQFFKYGMAKDGAQDIIWGNNTFGCVTHASLNNFETQIKYKYNIDIDFSDSFACVANGTRIGFGNYVIVVADYLSNYLTCLESDRPYDRDAKDAIEQFYALATEEQKKKADEQSKKWDIQYQWVPAIHDALVKALKQAPICVSVNTSNKIDAKGIYNHEVTLISADDNGYTVLDSNSQDYIEKYPRSYVFGSPIQYVVKKKDTAEDAIRDRFIYWSDDMPLSVMNKFLKTKYDKEILQGCFKKDFERIAQNEKEFKKVKKELSEIGKFGYLVVDDLGKTYLFK